MREVVAEPLTQAAFAPFGDVVSAGLGVGSAANQGTAVRFDWAARFLNGRADAKPNLAVFQSVAKELPFEVKLLERHPQSTQLFAPMKVDRYLVCVAPDDAHGEPDLDRLRAFVGEPGQGVNYRANTWHHPIIALGRTAEFLMLAWEDGTALDCEERPLLKPIRITT
jgi:ureidoglycolate lyase